MAAVVNIAVPAPATAAVAAAVVSPPKRRAGATTSRPVVSVTTSTISPIRVPATYSAPRPNRKARRREPCVTAKAEPWAVDRIALYVAQATNVPTTLPAAEIPIW